MRFALGNVADYIGRNNLESHIVNVVHDEIIIDATMGEVFELTEQVPVLMDFPLISEVVPILTDIEWSTTTWADKTTYEGIAVV
jgi:DNA polymerase I-like protein with 3'-5' exonuclease and polymerase domains